LNTGIVNGSTVIVLDTGFNTRPQTSVAVQVSVTVVPTAGGPGKNVDIFEVPVISQIPVIPLVKVIVPGTGIASQETVISGGGTIRGIGAGNTWIILDVVIKLPQTVVLQVSVISPPQLPDGICVLNVEVTDPVN
jgi:hypothetical protein